MLPARASTILRRASVAGRPAALNAAAGGAISAASLQLVQLAPTTAESSARQPDRPARGEPDFRFSFAAGEVELQMHGQ